MKRAGDVESHHELPSGAAAQHVSRRLGDADDQTLSWALIAHRAGAQLRFPTRDVLGSSPASIQPTLQATCLKDRLLASTIPRPLFLCRIYLRRLGDLRGPIPVAQQCLGPTDSDWNDKSFRVTERGCVGGRKQPAMLAGADFMQFSDATVSRRHFGIIFNKEVC